ncbi:hypothetical protein BS47DRAFT_831105 [Hydnum rufescens UP504]|uniref:Uncharacterized protein n=1 Tax=Hydnum rufescens UP504 TaxID=1448309 RepID=A0A9P6DXK7_9AGAM|nr:hypothetical protein BS47DRAFT_831105 [Hydnum rufescens UP504]
MIVVRRHLIDPPQLIRRNSFAPTLKEVLSETEDIKLYLFMPPSFLAYASDLIRQALVERGLIVKDEKGPNILYNVLVHRAEDDNYSKQNPVLVCWRINAVVAWQQVDRRIDELFEVLWAFYHSYSNVAGAPETEIVRRIFPRYPVGQLDLRQTTNSWHLQAGSPVHLPPRTRDIKILSVLVTVNGPGIRMKRILVKMNGLGMRMKRMTFRAVQA